MNYLDTDLDRHDLEDAAESDTDIPGFRQKVNLDCIETDNKTFITCETDLYFCPSSPGFGHGPVIMRYVSTLAEKILEKEEKIKKVSEILFQDIVRNNLRIVIYDARRENYTAPNNSAVTGMFITSKGRILKFYCLPLISKVITRRAGINTLAIDMVIPLHFRTDGELCRFKVNSTTLIKKQYGDIIDMPMLIYILMEVVSILIINYQNGFSLQKQWYLLSGKWENIQIPDSWQDLLNDEIELELQLLENRPPSGASVLSRFQFGLSFGSSILLYEPLVITMFGTESLSLMNRILGTSSS